MPRLHLGGKRKIHIFLPKKKINGKKVDCLAGEKEG